MEVYIGIFMFIIGTIFGSFYNVLGYRIPKGESIVYPSSHCTKCGLKLGFFELIPILSYVIQGGKCKKCHEKISAFYPIFEFITGLLFLLAYLSYGLTFDLIIALTFISLLVIITISDYIYMIIPDGILLFFGIALLIEIYLINGFDQMLYSLRDGLIAFAVMFGLKKFGDFIFKKESMGGGDIKLMSVFGIVLSYPVAILSIFVGSLIGLPISLLMMNKNEEHIIPFGPFLAAGALVLLLLQVDTSTIKTLLSL